MENENQEETSGTSAETQAIPGTKETTSDPDMKKGIVFKRICHVGNLRSLN